jgi:hypothetical protein
MDCYFRERRRYAAFVLYDEEYCCGLSGDRSDRRRRSGLAGDSLHVARLMNGFATFISTQIDR